MPAADASPTVEFRSRDEWAAWLERNHATATDGIWMRFAKKGSGIETVDYDAALDVALCYGWIDGQVKRLDDAYYLQRFTPRRARSKWSKRNCGKVEELIARGEMRPAGLAEVERAKADGRWEAAYDSPSTITVPDDLRDALAASPRAAELFARLSSTNRYAILYGIADAKRPETRTRRIEKFVSMLEDGRTPYPQRGV